MRHLRTLDSLIIDDKIADSERHTIKESGLLETKFFLSKHQDKKRNKKYFYNHLS